MFNSKEVMKDTKNYLFFSLLFIFQLLLTFQGLDLSDEGFLATFYQLIYQDPESVKFAFLYWFTGIVGGLYMKILPGLGLWGLRLAQVVVITLTAIFTYKLLKDHINRKFLKFGILIVVLTHNNSVTVINYNTLAALFHVLMVYYLFSGLKDGKNYKIALAGFFISLSFFTRISNLMDLGVIAILLLFNYLNRRTFIETIKQASLLILGFAVTSLVVALFMYQIGHLNIFLDSMGFLSKLGKTSTEVETGHNFYGATVIIERFISNYIYVIKTIIYFVLTVGIIYILYSYLIRKGVQDKWYVSLFKYALILAISLAMITEKYHEFSVLFLFTGLVLVTSFLILISKTNNDLKILSLFGCFLLITFPVTSSAGIVTAGRFSFWIGLPIAFSYIFSLMRIENSFQLESKQSMLSSGLSVSEIHLKPLKEIIGVVVFVVCLYHCFYYPFFDKNDRIYMRYPIENKFMKFIYTTEGRAKVMNDLLTASKKYVKPGDYVLAYDRIPMYHYITETKPFVTNPLVWLYEANELKDELSIDLKKRGGLPVIVQQKISTVLENKSWPYNMEKVSYFDMEMNIGRNQVLSEFIKENNYHTGWESDFFIIYVPPSK